MKGYDFNNQYQIQEIEMNVKAKHNSFVNKIFV